MPTEVTKSPHSELPLREVLDAAVFCSPISPTPGTNTAQ